MRLRLKFRKNFNPRPPHGGRPAAKVAEMSSAISIHAPHTEGDQRSVRLFRKILISIHAPHTEGDIDCGLPIDIFNISIHAPHTEGDRSNPPGYCINRYFNPRPPHGGRQEGRFEDGDEKIFQSTPPTRRATRPGMYVNAGELFQSTPPTRRATWNRKYYTYKYEYFNPRPPHGGRRPGRELPGDSGGFQSTPPTRRATAKIAK